MTLGGWYGTTLEWVGDIFDGPQDNELKLTISVRAPVVDIIFPSPIKEDTCDVTFSVVDVINLINMIVEAERQDEETRYISQVKTAREKMRRFQRAFKEILNKTGKLCSCIISLTNQTLTR